MVLGPKCTGFILFMSIWGAVFLAILGGLYYNESVGLLENLPDEPQSSLEDSWPTRRAYIKNQYQQNAYNCWAAGGAYAAIAVAAGLRAICLLQR